VEVSPSWCSLGIPFSWYPKGIIPVFAVDLATVFTECAVTRLGKRRIAVIDFSLQEPQHAQNISEISLTGNIFL
jgi:hypothetical protein